MAPRCLRPLLRGRDRRLQQHRELGAKIGCTKCPQMGFSALNSGQMVQEEMLGETRAPLAQEGRLGGKVQGVKRLPWKWHNHGTGWRVLMSPERFGSTCRSPPRATPWGRVLRLEPNPSPAAEAAWFVLMLAAMLIDSLIITAHSCNWARFAAIRGALEKHGHFPCKS